MDNHDRLNEAANALIDAYGDLTKALKVVPLGIGVESLADSPYAVEVHDSLIRAHEVLPDIPMEEEAKNLAQEMVLDWLHGSEAMFAAEEDPSDWRIDFVELQATRVQVTAAVVTEMVLRPSD